jgi:hypothetical protein
MASYKHQKLINSNWSHLYIILFVGEIKEMARERGKEKKMGQLGNP